jgi:hypothetical protein
MSHFFCSNTHLVAFEFQNEILMGMASTLTRPKKNPFRINMRYKGCNVEEDKSRWDK